MLTFETTKDGFGFAAYSKELPFCRGVGETESSSMQSLKRSIQDYLKEEMKVLDVRIKQLKNKNK